MVQKYTAGWLGFVSGSASNLNFFVDSQYWKEKEKTSYKQHIPFNEYDSFVGAPNKYFQEWVVRLSTPSDWSSYFWTTEDYAKMDMPILTVTGNYDGDQSGSLRYYKEHQFSASKKSVKDHHLVIGPWDHGGTRFPRRVLSEHIKFGPAAVIDMDKLNLDWFDWVLDRGPKPDFLKKRVTFYVGGDEEWRYIDSFESASNKRLKFYLSAAANEAYDVFRSGHLLNTPGGDESTHHFISDPLDTSFYDRADIDWNKIWDGEFRSVSPAFAPETLVFHSSPLNAKTTFAGQMKLSLYLDIDTPDADIFVTVYAIFPDGNPLYLGGDVVRARITLHHNAKYPSMLEVPVIAD